MRVIIILAILLALLAGNAAGQAETPLAAGALPGPGTVEENLQQVKTNLEATKNLLKTQAFGAQAGLIMTETEQTIDGKKVKVRTYTDPATGAVMTITLDAQGSVISAQMSQNGQVTPLKVRVEDGQIKLSMTDAATGSLLQVTIKSDGGTETMLATTTGQVLRTELSSEGTVVSERVVDTTAKTELTTTYNPDGSKVDTVADLAAGKAQTTETDSTGQANILPVVDVPALPEGASYCPNTGQWEIRIPGQAAKIHRRSFLLP
jgi:uncharacterized membrane-anchored protein YhcB (DUF1043 family)